MRGRGGPAGAHRCTSAGCSSSARSTLRSG